MFWGHYTHQSQEHMAGNLPHQETELDARDLNVRFSPPVQTALKTLTVIALKSDWFDPEMHAILEEWSSGKPTTIHDVMITLPLIAEQTAEHIKATGDERAKDAWRDLCTQLPENGFIVSQSLQRKR